MNARLSSSPLVLNESDAYFHELVSIYNLYRFSTFLNHHVYPGLTKKVELEFERKGRLSKETTFQLKSLATLINLGESQYEDSIVMMVNRIYRGAKEKGDRMMLLNLYGKILPYSLGKINTHSSIIKTIYLLDETTSGFFGDDFDNNFSFMYYLAVIYPKRDDKTIDLIDFETNKERIKKTTLNDNTIWWDYIKITE